MDKETTLQFSGNGLDAELSTLTAVVLGLPYGECVFPSEYRDRLRAGACQYYEQLNANSDDNSQQYLKRLYDFVDDLLRLTPVTQKGPLAFEHWLAAAVETFIRKYDLHEDRERFVYEIEWWGVVPSNAAEKASGMALTSKKISKTMAALADIPIEGREYLPAGRDDLHPFESKGTALAHGCPGVVMLRRLGILPDQWDRVYGSVVERLADVFCQLFYPVFRWIVSILTRSGFIKVSASR